jgi:hypothetical protein
MNPKKELIEKEVAGWKKIDNLLKMSNAMNESGFVM